MKPARAKLFFLLASVLLISTHADAAKLYKWVDEQGRVSYQDRPPPENSNFTETALSDPDAVDPATKSYQDKLAAAASKSPVVLYSIPDCDGCDLIRAYLEKRNIPFEEKNAEKDRKIQEELEGVAGRLEVPLLVLGERVLRGYSRPVMESEFDSAGFPKTEEKPAGIPKPTTATVPSAATEQPADPTRGEPSIDFEKAVQPATDDDIFKEQPAVANEGGT